MYLDALRGTDPLDENGDVNVFIETPMGSRHKYALDKRGLFTVTLELPAGLNFPFNFGFVPNTKAGDGDPLDILLLTSAPVPHGALINARLIGVLKMENEEDGEMVRNDRVIAVDCLSRVYARFEDLEETRDGLIWDVAEFFRTYNDMIDRPFKMIGHAGKDAAKDAFDEAVKNA